MGGEGVVYRRIRDPLNKSRPFGGRFSTKGVGSPLIIVLSQKVAHHCEKLTGYPFRWFPDERHPRGKCLEGGSRNRDVQRTPTFLIVGIVVQ